MQPHALAVTSLFKNNAFYKYFKNMDEKKKLGPDIGSVVISLLRQ